MAYKKYLTLILAVLLAFSLCACGDNAEQTSLHPTIAEPGSDAAADLSLPESVKVEAGAQDVCVYELVIDRERAKAQVESCFGIVLDEATKTPTELGDMYNTDEYTVQIDNESGYWTYSLLNKTPTKAGASLSDDAALGIAKKFIEENKLWPEEITNIKVVDQYGLNEALEYGVDTKTVYFYPQIGGKTVLGVYRISIDIDLTGKITSVFYLVNPIGEATQASLKSRADIAADVEARNYSASFSQDLTDAKINDCKLCYYADGVENGGKTYLYPVYVLMGEGKAADGSTETFDLIIDAQK